jgi:hypothetical protein
MAVRHPAGGALEHQEAARGAIGERLLGNERGRELVIEVAGLQSIDG